MLVQIAAVSAPPVLVILAGFSPTPSAAPATPATETLPVTAPAPAITPEQLRARQWAEAQPVGPGLVSPLERGESARVEAPQHAPEPEPLDPGDPLSGLTLKALLAGRNGALAMINGRIYRIGDEVRPGCTVLSIDAREDRIELSRPDGTTATLGRARD
jgi:hypothetical protein